MVLNMVSKKHQKHLNALHMAKNKVSMNLRYFDKNRKKLRIALFDDNLYNIID